LNAVKDLAFSTRFFFFFLSLNVKFNVNLATILFLIAWLDQMLSQVSGPHCSLF